MDGRRRQMLVGSLVLLQLGIRLQILGPIFKGRQEGRLLSISGGWLVAAVTGYSERHCAAKWCKLSLA